MANENPLPVAFYIRYPANADYGIFYRYLFISSETSASGMLTVLINVLLNRRFISSGRRFKFLNQTSLTKPFSSHSLGKV